MYSLYLDGVLPPFQLLSSSLNAFKNKTIHLSMHNENSTDNILIGQKFYTLKYWANSNVSNYLY